jgi:ribosomal protein S18 acetylase RimI-like enzyme
VADAARAAGARCLSLYTVRETGNVGIFERLGFKVIKEEEDLYDESDRYSALTEVYMEKKLERENQIASSKTPRNDGQEGRV